VAWWAGGVLIGLGLVMVPWLVVLADTLPATARAAHWALAWTGFDALEAAGLFATGLLLRRRDARAALTAAATAAFLVADAWFDTTTAAAGTERLVALLMAAGTELPLAAACVALALRTLRA
jgi:hypothetical protein